MKPLLFIFLASLAFAQQSAAPTRAALNKTVTLAVAADGTPPFTYQWFKDDIALPQQTADRLVLAPFAAEQVGLYHATVTNEAGSTTSNRVQLVPVKVPAKATITVNIAVGAVNP